MLVQALPVQAVQISETGYGFERYTCTVRDEIVNRTFYDTVVTPFLSRSFEIALCHLCIRLKFKVDHKSDMQVQLQVVERHKSEVKSWYCEA